MKRKLALFSFIALALVAGAKTSYVPIVKEGKQWVYYNRCETPNGIIYTPTVYEFDGDTLVSTPGSNYTFKKLYEDEYRFVADADIDNQWGGYIVHSRRLVALLRHGRTANRELYVRLRLSSYKWPPVGFVYDSEIPGYCHEYEVYNFMNEPNQVFMRYNLSVSELGHFFSSFGQKQEIVINGTTCDYYETDVPYRKMIEGIGYVQTNWELTDDGRYVSFPSFFNLNVSAYPECSRVLSHVVDNGIIVFKGELYDFFVENGFAPSAAGGIVIVEQ